LTIAPCPQDGGADLPVAQTGWLKQVLAGASGRRRANSDLRPGHMVAGEWVDSGINIYPLRWFILKFL